MTLVHFFRTQIAIIFFLVFCFSANTAYSEIKVTDLRIGDHGRFTRFVLDLSYPAKFKVFTLHSPYRVVIDFPNLSWQVQDRLRHTVLKNKHIGLIKNYRYGSFTNDTFRIVLDLTRPSQVIKAYLLNKNSQGKYRFVVDLKKTSHRYFVSNAGYNKGVGQKNEASHKIVQAPSTYMSNRPLTNNKIYQKPLIVIDPGHGGVDPGAISVSGAFEKNIVLSFAQRLRQELIATKRYRVMLTRTNDVFLPLRQRIQIARKAKASLFISLHADSVGKKKHVRGASVYTLSEKASDKEAEALAKKENQVDIIAGVNFRHTSGDVASVLIDLAQRDTMNKSAEYAQIAIKELKKVTKTVKSSHRFAGFAVLKAPDVPSALIELGYLSNPDDEKLLKSRYHQSRIAKSIVKSIDKFFKKTRSRL